MQIMCNRAGSNSLLRGANSEDKATKLVRVRAKVVEQFRIRLSNGRGREDYRATDPSPRFGASTSTEPFLRSLITNVLFSPSVDHGPRGTSLNSTKRQSVTSVSFNPR